ncbi:MAG: cupin domain-containing protein [candidate division Zixibacteria bacterium HGW-Zixibacteria-1]|nr:MAG: cupin domain-containing protein [candidate division Zixibacteria bacterium HGW-Zixibacteria-1]
MSDSDTRQNSAIVPAKVYFLEQMVDYADGAVVSRTISKNKAGTVTLFSFDTGQELSEHSAPFDALVHVLDGEAELMIGGEKVVAGTGELVIMPANVPHGVKAVQRFKMLLTMIRG